ncbi:putative repeat protein (TIGR01451 family) [Agromyces sp. 3263]|uniref:DUF7927 domain-containing protein n=1 Tax=Agromyces sp. 3263 TaxID=2817750 RepID=UPI002859A242|nr:hypothetical protein [Agromyces sp. 3263]MDR6904698.1 putative repeat protein (TIGR01451 family) [Agromyces sp. 3263]
MRARGGIRTILAGAVVGALVIFGAPTVAAAEEIPADPVGTEATVATEPVAEPAAEPAPAPDPVVEAEAPLAAVEESPPPPEPDPAAAPAVGSEPEATLSDATAQQAAARVAPADAGGPPVTTIPEWNDHVDICHATASATNPYVFISPSVRSIIDPNGDPNDEYDANHAHSMHQDFGDIIPEFDYFDKDGGQHHFPGLNLDLLPIFENDCNLPPVGVVLSVAPCPAVVTEGRTIEYDLSDLAISFDYELTVYVAGTTEVVGTVSFEAASGTLSGTFNPLPPGDYDVVLHRVGADPETDLMRTITLEACPLPFWELEKSSDPVDGATVPAGSTVTYTLTATNTSEVPVTDAVALDDVSDVLDNATLQLPLASGLSGPVDGVLTWDIPDLQPGDVATVSYSVTVDADATGELLHNVVAPTGDGECPVLEEDDPCVVDHPVGDVNLVLVKDAATDGDQPVDSGEGDVITYTLTITNEGQVAAFHSLVTDELPDGVTYVEGSAVISPNPAEWGPVEVVDGVMTVQHDGYIEPGDVIMITFDVTVGELAQPGTGPIPDLVNRACVASEPYEDPGMSGDGPLIGFEADESDNCDDATTPVKSIGLTAAAQCVNDTPLFDYSITPYNIDDPSANPIVLIWWTPDAFADRDPSIPASDVAAILADGASQVDPIAYPDGWMSGQPISDQKLWPGAEVDAAGNPIDWPGWTLLADGTWVLDPSAPFYDLRSEAVVEIRINPSNDAVAVYPPPTPNCNAAPPSNTPPTVVPASTSSSALPGTGFETGGFLAAALGLLVAGGVGLAAARSRRRMTE